MTDDDEPAVRITLRAIYEKQLEQGSLLQKLSESLPGHAKDVRDLELRHVRDMQDLQLAHEKDIKEYDLKIADLEARVRVLEASRWKQVGAYSLITVVVAFVEAAIYIFKK